MTGSTLYRRLPDGTWAAEREDGPGAAASVPPAGPPTALPPAVPPGGPGLPTEARPQRPPRRRSPLRTALRVVLVAVVAFAAWLAVLAVHAATSLQHVDALPANAIPDTPGQTWLLVGSDSRADLTKAERKELHTGGDEGSQRTDTIMLMHTAPGSLTPTLVSVPRDSWVTIPAHTAKNGAQVGPQQAKVNAAFAYGGAPLLAETIEYNTGLHVDHYMEVGMQGIVEMTDAVGGVEVCFDEPISDQNSGLKVDAGCQELDGKQALAWVRMRYADPKGDIGRIERQQQWVRLVADEILSWQTLLNPVRQWRLVDAVTSSVAVDQGTGPFALGRLGLGMAKVASGAAEVTTVPTMDSDHWVDGQWVLKWDPAQADALFGSLGGSTPQAQTAQ